MADVKSAYGSSAAITITLASLATSSTLVAGQQSDAVDNNSSTNYLDVAVRGKITTGTTPTVNTSIELWVIPRADDSNWPDVFTGAGTAAKTVTSRDILASCGRLAKVINVSATSNVAYWFDLNICDLFPTMPKAWLLFVVHNTAVNLNSTGGNHSVQQTPYYNTVV